MSDMGLSIAATGLAADSALLNTASNNLANIDTPGYAVESVNLSPEMTSGPLRSGQGVIVGSISRITDAVYAAVNVAAQGVQGGASQTNQVMNAIESIFPEPSANGIASQLTTLWSNLSTLAANPHQVGAEQVVVGAAQSLASSITSAFSQLGALSTTLQGEIGSGANDGGTLAQANNLLAQVAGLNASIVAGMAGGQNANALSDQASAAVNQLAGLLGVSARTEPSGTVSVYLNGVQLVSGNVAQTLSATGSAQTNNLSIVTSNGVTLNAAGSIGANVNALDSTIAGYQQQLNSVADSLATSLNALQANGLDANGDPGSAIAGLGTALPPIFVNNGSSSSYTPGGAGFNSAATIAVAPALLANPGLIATASAPGAGNSNVIGTPTFDGTNAQAMAALASSGTGPDLAYQTMIGDLGRAASNASATSSMASNLATTASNNVSGVSGVNENTEEVDILSAQNAFQANSRVVSAITQCFQSLIAAV